MIKIFDSDNSAWDKVNFVDDDDVLVGYDMEQLCCEDAGWFINSEVLSEIPSSLCKDVDLGSYVFDKGFFQRVTNKDELYEGAIAVFRLISETSKPLYLHLYNCHNGYYLHGFEFQVGGQNIKSGGI